MKKTLLFLAFFLGIALQSWAQIFYSYMGTTLYYEEVSNSKTSNVNVYVSSVGNTINSSGDITIPTDWTSPNGRYHYYVRGIKANAFNGCTSMRSLSMPSTITVIGDSAFMGCTNLTSFTFHQTITSIGKRVFEGCTSLTTVNFNATSCATMDSAFYGFAVPATLTIGENVQTIPQFSFLSFTGLSSLTIPSSVTSIGGYAFKDCSNLTTVNYNATNCTGNYYYSPFSGCSSLTTINIGENVSNIPKNIFKALTSLTSVNYNATNCTSAEGIFNGCTAPATLNIGENVQTIPYRTFAGFTGLPSLTIPCSVTSIGGYAFQDCSNLTTVNYNATNCTSMGTRSNPVFYGCTGPATLNIGGNVTQIPKYAFKDFTGLRGTITFPNSVTYIYDSAFCGCTGIDTLTFHTGTSSNQISFYKGAFQNCTGLTIVNLNARGIGCYYSSGPYPFSGCTSPATLNIGENVRCINKGCFANFTGLTGTLIIPDSVSRIGGDFSNSGYYTSSGGREFYNCSNITSLIIGSSVTEIDWLSFGNCTGLTEIHSRNSVAPTISHTSYTSERSFYGVPSNIPVYIPCGSLQSYQDEWAAYSNFTNFIEESGVTLNAVSHNEAMGTVHIDTYPDCTDSLATVSATANDGYLFDHWSDGSTDNPHTFSVISGMTITAYFGLAATVTVTSDNTTMGTASGSGTYAIGGTATISANANTGYHFTQWQDGNTDNPRTIDVASDTSFTAFFEINHYTVNVVSDNTELGSAAGGGTFDHGTSITISAEVIAENHHFAQWQDGNTDNPRTITVIADTTYTAYFAIDEYTITAVSDNTTMGTTSGSGSYAIGSTAIISANANYGYHFTQWNDGNTDNPCTVTVTGNATYTAYFEPNQYTVTVVSDNTEMGSVTGGGTFDYGTTITISAEAVADYHFTQWNDGNTQNPRTVTVTADITHTAYFAINEYTLTVVPNNTSYGTVAGGGTYAVGTTVTISAEANYGYHFTQWQDGNTDNPRTVTVTGNATYTANFEANDYIITVLSDNPTMGTVTSGGTYAYGSTISISAQPAEGCWFAYWQDGNNDNPRYITVTGNAEYVAHFYRPEGIDDVTSADDMKVYTRGKTIVIDFSGLQAADGRQSVVVYDVMGRVIKQTAGSGQQAAVEIPVTSAGVYMVRVGERPSRKVVVRP